ncbi:hypothetical protein ASL14_20055 [Paenibacillus sp. IHB B 3084]|uniref:hypothetical protein n=1 Tax=Paenibacillus sp. IHB B 3084 TaxID=867076 RepID=UPI00071ECAA8|nr:hypothetical protein [Paenibacillus sp. IHB B 3084]ALP38129.1 hypothetical protein ASL14_20055 [Paenibacillus sp. IHB B 3084]
MSCSYPFTTISKKHSQPARKATPPSGVMASIKRYGQKHSTALNPKSVVIRQKYSFEIVLTLTGLRHMQKDGLLSCTCGAGQQAYSAVEFYGMGIANVKQMVKLIKNKQPILG